MINDNSITTERRNAINSGLRLILNMTLDDLEKADKNIEVLAHDAHEAVGLLVQSARFGKQEREAERQPQQFEVRTVSLEEILSGLKAKIAAQHGIPI